MWILCPQSASVRGGYLSSIFPIKDDADRLPVHPDSVAVSKPFCFLPITEFGSVRKIRGLPFQAKGLPPYGGITSAGEFLDPGAGGVI
jgi:hypothetical protein